MGEREEGLFFIWWSGEGLVFLGGEEGKGAGFGGGGGEGCFFWEEWREEEEEERGACFGRGEEVRRVFSLGGGRKRGGGAVFFFESWLFFFLGGWGWLVLVGEEGGRGRLCFFLEASVCFFRLGGFCFFWEERELCFFFGGRKGGLCFGEWWPLFMGGGVASVFLFLVRPLFFWGGRRGSLCFFWEPLFFFWERGEGAGLGGREGGRWFGRERRGALFFMERRRSVVFFYWRGEVEGAGLGGRGGERWFWEGGEGERGRWFWEGRGAGLGEEEGACFIGERLVSGEGLVWEGLVWEVWEGMVWEVWRGGRLVWEGGGWFGRERLVWDGGSWFFGGAGLGEEGRGAGFGASPPLDLGPSDPRTGREEGAANPFEPFLGCRVFETRGILHLRHCVKLRIATTTSSELISIWRRFRQSMKSQIFFLKTCSTFIYFPLSQINHVGF